MTVSAPGVSSVAAGNNKTGEIVPSSVMVPPSVTIDTEVTSADPMVMTPAPVVSRVVLEAPAASAPWNTAVFVLVAVSVSVSAVVPCKFSEAPSVVWMIPVTSAEPKVTVPAPVVSRVVLATPAASAPWKIASPVVAAVNVSVLAVVPSTFRLEPWS